MFRKLLKLPQPIWWLGLIVIIGSILRAYNLNYNSFFSDEAIYVVVGQLGVFSGDWFSYNAGSWLSGSQFLYPILSGLAYAMGGVVGSRAVSVIAGVAMIGLSYGLAVELAINLKHRAIAGLTAAALVAGSVTSLYVSRLATMDMLAMSCMFGSLWIIQRAINQKVIDGQAFFGAATVLFLAGLIKLSIIFYFPFFVIYGLLATSKKQRRLFFGYFVLPLIIASIAYASLNFSQLRSFEVLQANRERASWLEIGQTIWQGLADLVPWAVIGALVSLVKLSKKSWAMLVIGAIWIVAIHLYNQRLSTLDKHLEISVVFLAILAGLGVSILVELATKLKLKMVAIGLLIAGLAFFGYYSYQQLDFFNHMWLNTSAGDEYLASHVRSGDSVLTEYGPTSILATYQTVGIENVTTFDFLKYQRLEGDHAYQKSVNDGYFKYILLTSDSLPKSDSNKARHDLIMASMDGNYEPIFSQNYITIYRRAF